MANKKHDTGIGTKWGLLTIISDGELKTIVDKKGRRNNRYYVLVKCECGNEKKVSRDGLVSGATKSCGCQTGKWKGKAASTHSLSDSPEYQSWSSMKSRCYNPKDKRYHDYGGRGVIVCDRWLHSFENFFSDMGIRPTPEHSLDRFPNNETGIYEPSNCRWATPLEQQQNMRSNINITVGNQTKTVAAWCRETGVNVNTVYQRIWKGWNPKDALLTPLLPLYDICPPSPVAQYDREGKVLIKEYPSIMEASRQTGISQPVITNICSGKIKHPRLFMWKKINNN